MDKPSHRERSGCGRAHATMGVQGKGRQSPPASAHRTPERDQRSETAHGFDTPTGPFDWSQLNGYFPVTSADHFR
jgi:hypothetical protein